MNTYSIGRIESNNYQIDNATVSGNHAVVHISVDYKTFTLQDLNTTNGTKINGQAIMRKKITTKDHIQFGDYVLDTKFFIKQLEEFILKNRIDFFKEFNALKVIEKKYLTKKNNTNKYFKIRAGLVKGCITIGLIVIISQLKILDEIEGGRMYLMIGVGAIGGIISTASISDKKVKHKLDDLYIEFTELFTCPKCKFDMTSKSWKFWRSKKKCPKCKCNWVEQTL